MRSKRWVLSSSSSSNVFKCITRSWEKGNQSRVVLWKCNFNDHNILTTLSLIISLSMNSYPKPYRIQSELVFDIISMHLEVGLKNISYLLDFNSISGVWKPNQTVVLLYLSPQSFLNRRSAKLRLVFHLATLGKGSLIFVPCSGLVMLLHVHSDITLVTTFSTWTQQRYLVTAVILKKSTTKEDWRNSSILRNACQGKWNYD